MDLVHTEELYLTLRVIIAVGQATLSEAGESHRMGERPPNSCQPVVNLILRDHQSCRQV
jgi:hypothetical protein